MFNSKYPIYLASQSPRRQKMLSIMGIPFSIIKVNTKEEFEENENPIKIVKNISLQKLQEAKNKIQEGIIISADTIVVVENRILGKPSSEFEARKFLELLSGKSHFVYTGFALENIGIKKTILGYSKTKVSFRKLETQEIIDYIKTGSPLDKAGAYGIQDDYGAVFVEKINGCYYNVLGFPMSKIYSALKSLI